MSNETSDERWDSVMEVIDGLIQHRIDQALAPILTRLDVIEQLLKEQSSEESQSH